jgi:hypothetical protein
LAANEFTVVLLGTGRHEAAMRAARKNGRGEACAPFPIEADANCS